MRFLHCVILVLLVASPRAGLGQDTPRTDLVRKLVGVWVLDRDASDSIGPLMELLEAPWFVRKIAGVMSPTVTVIRLGERSLRMVNENPIRTTSRPMPADGVEREREDPLGRRVLQSESWNDAGQLVVVEKLYVEEDRAVQINSSWDRVGESIVVTVRAKTSDGPLEIRRIFRPKR